MQNITVYCGQFKTKIKHSSQYFPLRPLSEGQKPCEWRASAIHGTEFATRYIRITKHKATDMPLKKTISIILLLFLNTVKTIPPLHALQF
jgi:hypothetical protein